MARSETVTKEDAGLLLTRQQLQAAHGQAQQAANWLAAHNHKRILHEVESASNLLLEAILQIDVVLFNDSVVERAEFFGNQKAGGS